MKRFSALFFCFILLINIVVLAEEPKVNAISAVVVDGDTGRILWGKNENKPMAMASTTKIMTALVALENSDVTKETTVSKNATLASPVKNAPFCWRKNDYRTAFICYDVTVL